VDGEGHRARRWLVIVGEVVDQLFHTHGVLGRELPVVQEAAHDRVRRGVDVDGEGRSRILRDEDERVVADVVVGFGIERSRRVAELVDTRGPGVFLEAVGNAWT